MIIDFILGMLFCALAGALDRNPTTLRMVTVMLVYAIGLQFLIDCFHKVMP